MLCSQMSLRGPGLVRVKPPQMRFGRNKPMETAPPKEIKDLSFLLLAAGISSGYLYGRSCCGSSMPNSYMVRQF